MMKNETVSYARYKITVGEATVAMGLTRSELRGEALGDGVFLSFEQRVLKDLTYPDLVAATLSAENLPWPLDFDDFLNLPDALLERWENAVYRLNPHWLPSNPTSELVDCIVRPLVAQRKRYNAEKDLPPELPESIHLNGLPEAAIHIFQLLELSGWRWDINTIRQQPESIMADVLTVGTIARKVEKMVGNGR